MRGIGVVVVSGLLCSVGMVRGGCKCHLFPSFFPRLVSWRLEATVAVLECK